MFLVLVLAVQATDERVPLMKFRLEGSEQLSPLVCTVPCHVADVSLQLDKASFFLDGSVESWNKGSSNVQASRRGGKAGNELRSALGSGHDDKLPPSCKDLGKDECRWASTCLSERTKRLRAAIFSK